MGRGDFAQGGESAERARCQARGWGGACNADRQGGGVPLRYPPPPHPRARLRPFHSSVSAGRAPFLVAGWEPLEGPEQPPPTRRAGTRPATGTVPAARPGTRLAQGEPGPAGLPGNPPNRAGTGPLNRRFWVEEPARKRAAAERSRGDALLMHLICTRYKLICTSDELICTCLCT